MKMILVLFAGIVLLSTTYGQLDVPGCPLNGEEFQECRTCPATCFNPGLICIAQCIPGCGCPSGQLIDTVNNTCVDPEECPLPTDCAAVSCLRPVCTTEAQRQCCPACADPCDNYTCPTGSQCEVFEPTGEAFCDSSCDLDNGGCPANQICSLQIVQCIRAPCPTFVQCTPTDPCTNVTCRTGSRCRIDELTGEANCEPSCIDNGGCPANRTCFLDTLRCLNPPCPRIVRCLPIDPCDNHMCPIGSQCKVYRPTGEAFCEPSCDLDNGGCPANQECSLQTVQCVRAPCPPVVQCTPRCPPKCSHEFCSNRTNRYKPCSQPSVTIPSCPDRCSTTFCNACYYSETAVPTYFLCDNLCRYPPSRRCLYKWSICLQTYSILKKIHRGESSDFRCFEYACPQRG